MSTSKPRLVPKLVDTPAEREAIYRLRAEVHGPSEDPEPSFVDPQDEASDLFAVFADEQIIASIRVSRGSTLEFPAHWSTIYGLAALGEQIPHVRVAVSGRLVIHPKWRTSKALGLLLALAYRDAREHGIWIEFTDCAPALIALYEQLGYRRYAPAFVDNQSGNRVPMLMLTEDLNHLKLVRSPLLQLSRQYRSSKKHPEQAEAGKHSAQIAQAWFHRSYPEHAKYVNRRALRGATFWTLLASKLSERLADAIPLFHGLEDKQVQAFLDSGALMSFASGETIVRSGERGDEMFIILSGLAEVLARSGDETVSINLLGKGEIIGEMALLGEHERSAEVLARADLEALVISRHSLRRAMKSHPAMMCAVLYNLSSILAERLRLSTQNWMELADETDAETAPT